MTCPHCGARNTADAPWCTQCLQPLGQASAPAPEPSSPPADPAAAGAAPASHPPPVRDAPAGDATHGSFRSIDGQVEWRCHACQTWNALETQACAACGSRLAASVTGSVSSDVSDRVSRARRILWVAAAIGGLIAVASVVLLVLALQAGAGG